MRQPEFCNLDDRLKALSANENVLEKLSDLVDFEQLRSLLKPTIERSGWEQGRSPAYDLVCMFKVLILHTSHSLSDERTEFLIRDRLPFMHFPGLSLADPVPEANTIWTFRVGSDTDCP